MPSLLTHYKFGNDILNNLSKPLQEQISSNISYYHIFCQGFDNLFCSPIRWNKYRKFGISCHKNSINDFFSNTIDYIINNNLQNNSTITNMLYGFINHITMDYVIHPFIDYQVEALNISHIGIELMLDSKILSNNKRVFKDAIPRVKFPIDLNNCINYIFNKTYNVQNIARIMNLSHNNSYYIFRYFIYDKYGIKSKIYKLADIILRFKDITFSESTIKENNFDERILNVNRKEYKYNYEDLYNYSITIASKLNELTYLTINKQYDKDKLLNLINNISVQNIQLFL